MFFLFKSSCPSWTGQYSFSSISDACMRTAHRTAGSSVRDKLKPVIRNLRSAVFVPLFVQLNTHLCRLKCLHNEQLKSRSCLQLPFNAQGGRKYRPSFLEKLQCLWCPELLFVSVMYYGPYPNVSTLQNVLGFLFISNCFVNMADTRWFLIYWPKRMIALFPELFSRFYQLSI